MTVGRTGVTRRRPTLAITRALSRQRQLGREQWRNTRAIGKASPPFVPPLIRVRRNSAGHAAKTDRLDARRLADALRQDSVVRIDIPLPEIRALREVCRGRHQLVRVRTQMIRALLLRWCGEPPGTTLYAARALAWLTMVRSHRRRRRLRRLERLYRAVHADARQTQR